MSGMRTSVKKTASLPKKALPAIPMSEAHFLFSPMRVKQRLTGNASSET
jgi:hypothetical protein